MSRARVHPRESRQIHTRIGGYLGAFTHTLQPYVGCEFSCVCALVSQEGFNDLSFARG